MWVLALLLLSLLALLFWLSSRVMPLSSSDGCLSGQPPLLRSLDLARVDRLSSRERFALLVHRVYDRLQHRDRRKDEADHSNSAQALSSSLISTAPTRICLFTADVPFTLTNGGTATAYYLLGQHLATLPSVQVTLVGLIHPDMTATAPLPFDCSPSIRDALKSVGMSYDCLHPSDMRVSNRSLVSLHPWDSLALAVVEWMDRSKGSCHIIHGHEWGGVMAYLALILRLEPERFPGVTLSIQPHGGHLWSEIGGSGRSSDMGALRIDDLERTALEWSDQVQSPSRYMLGYLAVRGWTLPQRYVLPNVIEGAATASSTSIAGKMRPVWRMCFLGRLESRKGIKLFVRAVSLLFESRYWEQTSRGLPIPEVLIIGSSRVIDGLPSDVWLDRYMEEHRWGFITHVHIGLNRSSALSLVRQEGILLVLPSLQENLPFVVAEAAMLGVPLLAFDVGGSHEVLKLQVEDKESYCKETTISCLYQHMRTIMERGKHYLTEISPSMVGAEQAWTTWHRAHQIVTQQHELTGEERAWLHHDNGWGPGHPSGSTTSQHTDQSTNGPDIRIVHLSADQPVDMSVLHREVCGSGHLQQVLPGRVEEEQEDGDGSERSDGGTSGSALEAVLLLPEQFELLPTSLRAMSSLLVGWSSSTSALSHIGALTFGVRMDDATISYATAPTWLLYSASHMRCEESFPVLIRQHVLCQSAAVDTHAFPVYTPWLVADVLGQQSMRMITYPDVLFRYREELSMSRLSESVSCQPWSVPVGRYDNAAQLDHMHRDVSEDMRDLYFPRGPTRLQYTDLATALRTPIKVVDEQQQLWSFKQGSLSQWKAGAIAEEGGIVWFHWIADERRFGCDNSTHFPYPQVDYNSVVHPCVSVQGMCCGQSIKLSSLVRYTFTEDQTMTGSHMHIRLVYEADPSCGDGLRIRVHYTDVRLDRARELLNVRIESVLSGPARRRKAEQIELTALEAGSWLDVTIDPLDTQLCDGVYLNIQMSQ